MLVRSTEYSQRLTDDAYPELANSFLCKALIAEYSEDYATAAWSLIHAAWVCDDQDKDVSAATCRSRAADMIDKALAKKQTFSKQKGAETAIQVDLLRRAGRLNDARQLVARPRPAIKEDVILKILDFQEFLIEQGNRSRYTISDALG